MTHPTKENVAPLLTEQRLASVPLFSTLRIYRREWLKADAMAGLSVAAIQIPTAIAYANLAGLPPLAGLYAAILPLVAYALLGSSRQLIVGPDSATCAMIAAALAPLAVAGTQHYNDMSMLLAIMVGLLSILGGIMRLGFIADFLSRPILLGFMNGVALSIIVGQLGKLSGISLDARDPFLVILELSGRLADAHWPTLTLGLLALALLVAFSWRLPRLPGPLLIIVLLSAATWLFGLDRAGIQVVGAVEGGLPTLSLPSVGLRDAQAMFGEAVAIALVSFCSAMLPARSFAAKNRYRIYPNQDLIALGTANVTSGLSGGFVISGADSRTAINDMVGGKTSMVNLATAIFTALAVVLLDGGLAWIPTAALGAVLIIAALKMVDIAAVRALAKVSPFELRVSLLATLGVLTLGVLPGIILAVLLSLVKQLRLVARPRDAVLGEVPNGSRLFNVAHYPAASSPMGVLVYRFDASLLFFNSDYFRERLRVLISHSAQPISAVVLDAQPIATLDITGALMLEEVQAELADQGIVFCIAGAHGQFRELLERSGLAEKIGARHLFATSLEAVNSLRAEFSARAQASPAPDSL
ncbi:SulP family inorganic anion transporter [Kerstersia gyiorum]|uniref:SulP family inorganic anion transporter n=1 Tax=Kerstersia gyiorum TaxID=206506 RepID=UPI00209DF547|nr:SulP family inorganic anion transporter [Kerstersia gyiorum]MCP1637763.1 high affinity sulfate transporter 1 [Kerstersia gyiorum]MCP1671969.1 high affinity sulfate transporter 1 [Kerstersia gyiorum]MCP1709967.1 high affinity sulfate transporter 1 [Kerstersia gyiorum]